MIGQEKLINKLTNYSINNLPKSILLIGESGCGKHTLVNLISKHFNIEYIKINSKTTQEELFEYTCCPIDKFYIINLSAVGENQQNQFLKIVEEPSENMHIILFAESEQFILNTIKNRCIKFYFEDYTEEQLRQIREYENNVVYKICKTPGQILSLDSNQVENLCSLCKVIIEKINIARYSNTLSISNKINYDEQYDKFDINMFFNAMTYFSFEDYINNKSNLSYNIYLATQKYKQRLSNKSFNKENIVISYLDLLYNISKEN